MNLKLGPTARGLYSVGSVSGFYSSGSHVQYIFVPKVGCVMVIFCLFIVTHCLLFKGWFLPDRFMGMSQIQKCFRIFVLAGIIRNVGSVSLWNPDSLSINWLGIVSLHIYRSFGGQCLVSLLIEFFLLASDSMCSLPFRFGLLPPNVRACVGLIAILRELNS